MVLCQSSRNSERLRKSRLRLDKSVSLVNITPKIMTGLSDSEFRSSSFYMFSLILFKVEFLLVKYDSNTWSNFGSVKWAKKDGSMNFELVIWNENTRLFVLVRVRVLLLLRRNTSSPESVFDILEAKACSCSIFSKIPCSCSFMFG